MTLHATALPVLVLSVPFADARAACQRNEYGVFEDSACASEAFTKADKELNDTYKQLLAVVDEDAKQKLRAAQRAWVDYRDANAAFVYSIEGDGPAGRMVAWNDSERQTRARVDELRNWLPRN